MSTLYNKIKIELFPEDPILRCKYSNCLKDLNKYLWNNKTIYFKPLWRSKEQPIKQAFEKFKYKMIILIIFNIIPVVVVV